MKTYTIIGGVNGVGKSSFSGRWEAVAKVLPYGLTPFGITKWST